jgi:hypothetical protein
MVSRRRGLLVTVIRMALYPIVVEMKKLLGQMTTWVDKAEAHAASKGHDPAVSLRSPA